MILALLIIGAHAWSKDARPLLRHEVLRPKDASVYITTRGDVEVPANLTGSRQRAEAGEALLDSLEAAEKAEGEAGGEAEGEAEGEADVNVEEETVPKALDEGPLEMGVDPTETKEPQEDLEGEAAEEVKEEVEKEEPVKEPPNATKEDCAECDDIAQLFHFLEEVGQDPDPENQAPAEPEKGDDAQAPEDGGEEAPESGEDAPEDGPTDQAPEQAPEGEAPAGEAPEAEPASLLLKEEVEVAKCSMGVWCQDFQKAGITAADQGKITFKENEWLYNGEQTEVGKGDAFSFCDKDELFCAGGKNYGSRLQQAQAIKAAIENFGVHPTQAKCGLSKWWCKLLETAGIPKKDISYLTVKGEWYYKGKSTKVGMGSFRKNCDKSKVFCAGGEGFGFGIQQAKAVKAAIQNGGLHPDMILCRLGTYWCPLMKKAGISDELVQRVTYSSSKGEWLFDGEGLKVGFGQYNKPCRSRELFCAGQTKFGGGLQQAQAVHAAIQNHGVHPAKASYRRFQGYCVLSNGRTAQQDGGRALESSEQCATTCDTSAGCTAYQWLASQKKCFLYLNQQVGKGQGAGESLCYVKKDRRCVQFASWRKKSLGSHVHISLGKSAYGANVGSWSACLDLCEAQKECKQVVYTGGRCFGMLARSDLDENQKGGKNVGFMSAHCFDKEILHHVASCTQCGKSLCDQLAKNEPDLEKFYMMGTPLSSWGCQQIYSQPFSVVRGTKGAIYVVESAAEQASACPFLNPHFGALEEVLCEDGVYSQDGQCLKHGRGHVAQCPQDLPVMCAKPSCGEKKNDFCCRRSCEDLGGPRRCGEAVSYYPNSKALSWSKLQEQCGLQGKRLCTYSEICEKVGVRPRGGLQSNSDAWCPIIGDDLQPNYVQVGAVNVHPTCKKMTDDPRFDWTAWGWPLKDSGAQYKEVYACCEGFSGAGRWAGKPMQRRQQSESDTLTIRGRRWNKIFYSNLPKYITASWPLPGPKDINTGNAMEVELPQTSLVYLLRVDGWSGVPLQGWVNTGHVGRYLNYYRQVRIYWKLFWAGKHVVDNLSGMYLFDGLKRLSGCFGTETAKTPQFFVWPEKYPAQPARSVEEVWAFNQQGLYGPKVREMQFVALTLKDNQDNGGAYDILFSTVPASEGLLPSTDCAAGTSMKLGTRPSSKPRQELPTSWKGTTWQVYMKQDLWAAYGSAKTKCSESAIVEVADRSECQLKAMAVGDYYYQLLLRANMPALCSTSSRCDAPAIGLEEAWQVYSKDGHFVSQGLDTSCEVARSLNFVGNGWCSNGQVFGSSAWALADAKFGQKAFNTDQYKAWVKAAWSNCLAKDPDVNFVSVWVDAGYRCYKTFDCKPNGGGGPRTFSGTALGKAFVHLRIYENTPGNRQYLSTYPGGRRMALHHLDDVSGRQRWRLVRGAGDWYHIRVLEGSGSSRTFLSSNVVGTKVELAVKDDGSGRQRWRIVRAGPWAYVQVQGGVRGTRRFLSATASGAILLTDKDYGARERWVIGLEADSESFSTYFQKNFVRGNLNLRANQQFNYILSAGYPVTLTGWTHTRTYARGFLCNVNRRAYAIVSGLEPGSFYAWRIIQGAVHYGGRALLWANGIPEGHIYSFNSVEPNKRGMTMADKNGKITFSFLRQSGIHVQLSALALKKVDEAVDEYLTTMEENNFAWPPNRNLHPSQTHSYNLHNGYRVALTGWTHTRAYHKGFLRNRPGYAYATVSGLEPGAEYAWKLYQYSSHRAFLGANHLYVNGDYLGTGNQQKSSAPARVGLSQADGDGKIRFSFLRTRPHVALTGLAIAKLNSGPTKLRQIATREQCREACAGRPWCTGFERFGHNCDLWSTPVASGKSLRGSECVALRPEYVYALKHTGKGGDGKRFARGPGGLRGTEVANGERGYVSGPYEMILGQSQQQCASLCSSKAWCAGYGFKDTRTIGARPDWRKDTCQLVAREISGVTGITQFKSYSKVGQWVSHGQRLCLAEQPMLLAFEGWCTRGQIFSSSAWALALPGVGERKGFHSPEYASWVRAAWQSCLEKNPKTTHVSVWTDAGYRCYVNSLNACNGRTAGAVRTWTAPTKEVFSTLQQQNFNGPQKNFANFNQRHTYKLLNGYTVVLYQWTHTRHYAMGFLRNRPGVAYAVVSGLERGALYAWKVYQYASAVAGKNYLVVNNLHQGFTYQRRFTGPTRIGVSEADRHGRLVFTFHRNSHHVHFSGLSVRKLKQGKTENLLALNRLPRWSRNANLHMQHDYMMPLANGYMVQLHGWTHQRTYHMGYLRNRPGHARAVVLNLKPGALYAWKIYQYASAAAGRNHLHVQGQHMGVTITTKDRQLPPSKTGAHRANEFGQISFSFRRNSGHVALSGIALAQVQEETGDGWLSSFFDNNFNDRLNANLNWNHAYHYILNNGYPVVLSGWTHTRHYSAGFLCNRHGTRPRALVKGLKPGKLYAWRVYQYAAAYGGWNSMHVNGKNTIKTFSKKSYAATASGMDYANARGELLFEFIRQAVHVQLSALTVAEVKEKPPAQPVQDVAAVSVDACKRSCETTQFCGGVQYDAAKKRCAVWKAPLQGSAKTTTPVECLSWKPL